MKKIILLSVLIPLVTSCYEDLSTDATMELPELMVEGSDEIVNVSYGQELEMSVSASQEGSSPEDFTYLWEIDLRPGSTKDRIWLGDTPQISYKVANTPSDEPYYLTCKVTDTKTGLYVIKSWKVYVASSLGEGLLVAYTRDGGQTSELDLVSNQAVTYGYAADEPSYTRELYAFANEGLKLEGRVNSMAPFVCSKDASFSENQIVLGTDRNIFTIDPLTYKVDRKDADLFNLIEADKFETQMVFNCGGYSLCAIVNHKLYAMLGNSAASYNLVPISSASAEAFNVNNVAYAEQSQGDVVLFSPVEDKFYFAPGWQIGMGSFSSLNITPSMNLAGAECLAGGCTRGDNSITIAMVMNTTDGKYHVLTIDLEKSEPQLTEYALSGKDLDKAVAFAFCDNADIMYYATESKIYSTIFSAGKATVTELTWKPDQAGEKITSIRQYKQGWYGTHGYGLSDYEFPLSTNRLQMMITTYNEETGEGKIYLRPFNVSTGKFTFKSNGTFGGFGEITAVTPTLR